ncbi:mitochondrial 40S ribosomal protein-like protein MRP2 [Ascodesmis nigricans]|uniref:Mitochondrial 40S ribosomal protein-like protein MRP2 n=1 Tax=Ascodesmis nigricans TaxID=341454 RepID=A0A4S2N866_9PEZI|nr:mitochondrial 40S ribosomal protein-like protein MRP2 [Ascodesmis nigricans]
MFPTPRLLSFGGRLPIGGFVNTRVLRDHQKRQVFAANETHRNALRYLARNTTLPMTLRMKAQMQLNEMHCHTRRVQIRNRCIMSGYGRSVFRDFRMCRFQFRLNAMKGSIPGVKKASW